MDFLDIFIRTFSGFVWIALVLIIWFHFHSKKSPLHKLGTYIFAFYLIGVLVMTGIGKLGEFSFEWAWPPFESWSQPGSVSIRFLEPFLNVVLFFPLGFFLPLLYRFNRSFFKTLLTGFLFSLSIECLQMFSRGISDVSDLVCNTFGTVLGFLFFWILQKKVNFRPFLASLKYEKQEEALLFISCIVVMITIQPWLISTLFNLG